MRSRMLAGFREIIENLSFFLPAAERIFFIRRVYLTASYTGDNCDERRVKAGDFYGNFAANAVSVNYHFALWTSIWSRARPRSFN